MCACMVMTKQKKEDSGRDGDSGSDSECRSPQCSSCRAHLTERHRMEIHRLFVSYLRKRTPGPFHIPPVAYKECCVRDTLAMVYKPASGDKHDLNRPRRSKSRRRSPP